MFRGRKFRDITFAVAGIVVLVVGFIGLFQLLQKQEYPQQTTSYSANDKAESDKNFAVCDGLPASRQIICIRDAFNAERDSQRADEDVNAQKYMANAAFWTWVVSWVQALVAVGGIYFIARTLDANRISTDEAIKANKLMQSEQRAWLSIILEQAFEMNGGEETFALSAFLNIENSGHSPAVGVRLYFKLILPDFDIGPAPPLETFVSDCRGKYGTDKDTVTFVVFPNQKYIVERPKVITAASPKDVHGVEPGVYVLLCCAIYRTGIEQEILHTGSVFTILRSSTDKARARTVRGITVYGLKSVETFDGGTFSIS